MGGLAGHMVLEDWLRTHPTAPVAVLAGSGIELDDVLDEVEERHSFATEGALATKPVAGHRQCHLRGRTGSREIFLQCGRRHLYEGYGLAEVIEPLRWLMQWGARAFILTCAAGGLSADSMPGQWRCVREVCILPYRRDVVPWGLFPNFGRIACTLQAPSAFTSAVYAWVHGPSYETKAEIAALRRVGCDVVGMSLGPEVWFCRTEKLPVAALACVTNLCGQGPVTHDEVVTISRNASASLVQALRNLLYTP